MISESVVLASHVSKPDFTTLGTVTIATYDKKLRTTRALKTLGKIWGLAVLSVLLPLLHFFLPWIGILAGPLLAAWVYGIESEVQGGKAICPKCAEEFKIVKQRTRFPLHELCTHCQSEILVSLK